MRAKLKSSPGQEEFGFSDRIRRQSDRAAGDAGAAQGIQLAHDHTEKIDAGWSERALGALLRYIKAHPGEEFIAPEVRKWSEKNGLAAPASQYAWGNVFRVAAQRRIIIRVRYGQYGDSTMHTQSVSVWRAYEQPS